MRTIYLDCEYKCHVADDGTMTAVETDSFDGKCDAYIEGFCYDTSKGYVHVYPWKPFAALDAAQRAYEKQQMAAYEAFLNELYAEVTGE